MKWRPPPRVGGEEGEHPSSHPGSAGPAVPTVPMRAGVAEAVGAGLGSGPHQWSGGQGSGHGVSERGACGGPGEDAENLVERLQEWVCEPGAGGRGRPVQGPGHSGGRPGGMLRGTEGLPGSFPAEKRVLLVKELQGLTVAQQDHMLRGMPLSLAEKHCLRSVPAGRAGGQGLEPAAGWSPGGVGPQPGPALPLPTGRRPGPRGGSSSPASLGSCPAAAVSDTPVSW